MEVSKTLLILIGVVFRDFNSNQPGLTFCHHVVEVVLMHDILNLQYRVTHIYKIITSNWILRKIQLLVIILYIWVTLYCKLSMSCIKTTSTTWWQKVNPGWFELKSLNTTPIRIKRVFDTSTVNIMYNNNQLHTLRR